MAAAIALLGLLRWSLHGFAPFPLYFGGVAALFLGAALLAPALLGPVLAVWMKFALLINGIMTRLLLALAFYLMITPVRIIIRVFGEDPLKRAWLPRSSTYWQDAEEQPEEFDRYRYQS